MPRFPEVAPHVRAIEGGVYSKFAARIAALEGEVYPLNVGDTWMEPIEGARMEDLKTSAHPGMHRYTGTRGMPALIDAIAEKRGIDGERVLVTASGTAGLKILANALLAPGDEVMILAPYWPLIAGIVKTSGGQPVEVPFLDQGGEDIAARLEASRTDRTVAIYINTPNNPTNQVYSLSVIQAIADFARAHGLWIWSDEIYEDYAYRGEVFPIAALAPERTFSAYSFSKAYGLAGLRTGYLVGPSADAIAEVHKVGLYSYYSAPTPGQLSALHVIRHGQPWIDAARESYQRAGDHAAATLGLPLPGGGQFLFPDVSAYLDERGLGGFLSDCLDRNLVLAPGSSFGPESYSEHVRICFTCAPPDVVRRGIESLAELLAEKAT
ncbi:MAG: aspartate/methionine/tyrosine aminotransferase [Myxococcota bacterium]|jgi:aspartate/methionine/tyrosine aminotransferase